MNRSFNSDSRNGNMRKLAALLRSRLANQGHDAGGHPDPDSLLAFSEHSLRRREHAAVLRHLSSCAECREIVALSLPEDLPKPATKAHAAWTAVAAMAFVCLSVAALVVPILRTRPPGKSVLPEIAKNIRRLPPQPVPAPAASQATTPPSPKVRPHKLHKEPPRTSAPVSVTPPSPVSETGQSYLLKEDAFGKPAQTRPDQARALLQRAEAEAEITAAPPPQQRLEVQRKNTMAPNAGFIFAAPAISVQAFAPALGAAKPVVWTLEPASIRGAVRRSGDGGKTWETVSVDNTTKFYALSASQTDIWVGGAHGELFHSMDGGGHWLPVAVVNESLRLSVPIVKIDQHGTGVLTLKTSTGTIWTSQDRGLHWRRDPE
jgi:Photosynthesis system II assembly factor YCF48